MNKMSRAPQVPFQELDNEIKEYRNTLADIIADKYAQARNEDKSLGSDKIQHSIFNEFINQITLSRIKRFCRSYHTVLDHRERELKDYVKESVQTIRDWERFNIQTKKWEKYNSHLEERYFLKVIARYDGEVVLVS